jgi:hypothetical protein
VSRPPVIDEDTIMQVLDGKWRTIAKIRTKLGRCPAVEIAARLQRMAEAGKIEQMSETTTALRRGQPLKIRSYRRRIDSF